MHAATADVFPPNNLLDRIPEGRERRIRFPSLGSLLVGFGAASALGVAVLAITLLGHRRVPLTRTPAPPSAPQASTAACRGHVSYVYSAAGTGLVFAHFRIRNDGRAACRLGRYPAIRLVGPGETPLNVRQNAGGIHDPADVPVTVLSARGIAHFSVEFRPLTAGGDRRCAPAARSARIRFASGPITRVVLPTQLGLVREPINPCPQTAFLVTRIARGA